MCDISIKHDKHITENDKKHFENYKSLFENYIKLKRKSNQLDSLSTTLEKYESEINSILDEMEKQYNAMMNVSNYLDRMVLKDTENSYANRKGKEQQKMFLNLLEKQQREILHLKRLLKQK